MSRDLSERQLDRIRAAAEGSDVAFVLTYSEDGALQAEGFHDGINEMEAYAFAAFLESYARDIVDHTETQALLVAAFLESYARDIVDHTETQALLGGDS